MKQFFKFTKKYSEYTFLATQFKLKSGIASSRLGYLWWLLDPLLFMLVYTLVVTVIFQRNIEHANVFILSALMPWRWFSAALSSAPTSISGRFAIIEQVYVPKYILTQIDLLTSVFKFLITLPLTLFIMLISGVMPTWHIIETIPILLSMMIFLYGSMMVISHIGVYLTDIKNIIAVVIRFMFYLSPIMYDINQFSNVSYSWLWWINPMTTFGTSFRNIFYFGESPTYLALAVWTIIGLIFIILGVKILDKYDRNYVKMK